MTAKTVAVLGSRKQALFLRVVLLGFLLCAIQGTVHAGFTCGNASCETNSGENCGNCYIDCPCNPGQACNASNVCVAASKKYKCSSNTCLRDDVNGIYSTSNCNDACTPAPKYKCNGATCVQDDVNGTFTTSDCDNICLGPCLQASCYKCNGTACVQDNVNGTYSAVNCNSECAPIGPCGASICYRCNGTTCIRDDGAGTFQTSTCGGFCSGTASVNQPITATGVGSLKTRLVTLDNNRTCFSLVWDTFDANVQVGKPIRAFDIMTLVTNVNTAYRGLTGNQAATLLPLSASQISQNKVIRAQDIMDGPNSINAAITTVEALNCPVAGPNCPNGALNAGEQCDDNNSINGDGCSSVCVCEYSWANDACGGGTCASDQMHQTGTSLSPQCSPTTRCIADVSCGGPICGQDGCQVGENCSNYPADCPNNTCPNNCCEAGEDSVSCPADCGGAETCSDGIQNQGETGVDCGGPCAACGGPTCSDGIKNQDETGVDCGGSICPHCLPVCGDSSLDPGETCDPPNPGVCDIDCHRHYACSAEICVFTAGGLYTDDSSCGGTCGACVPTGCQDTDTIPCGAPGRDNCGGIDPTCDKGTDPSICGVCGGPTGNPPNVCCNKGPAKCGCDYDTGCFNL